MFPQRVWIAPRSCRSDTCRWWRRPIGCDADFGPDSRAHSGIAILRLYTRLHCTGIEWRLETDRQAKTWRLLQHTRQNVNDDQGDVFSVTIQRPGYNSIFVAISIRLLTGADGARGKTTVRHGWDATDVSIHGSSSSRFVDDTIRSHIRSTSSSCSPLTTAAQLPIMTYRLCKWRPKSWLCMLSKMVP